MAIEPEDCPDPSVHGNPFRYCPYCTWMEEPEPAAPSFEVQMLHVAIEALKAERDDLRAGLEEAQAKSDRYFANWKTAEGHALTHAQAAGQLAEAHPRRRCDFALAKDA